MNKTKDYRWHMIAPVCFITVINYLDRTALGIAAPTIMETIGITKEQHSWTVSVFQSACTLEQPIMGFFIDTVGLKLSSAICAAIWGLAIVGHTLTEAWSGLVFIRALMGFSEASTIPAGVRIALARFPVRERGAATGAFNMGTSFGMMLTPPLAAWRIMFHSWQLAFIAPGSLALLAVLLWFFRYKDLKDAKRFSDEERHYIESGQEQHLKTDKKEKTSIKHILSQCNFWGIGIACLLADPAWGIINFWVSIFFVETLRFSLKEITTFVWLPFLLGDLGCLASGFVAKFFHGRGASLINSRRITSTITAAITMTIGLVSIVENPYIAVLLTSIGAFPYQCPSIVVTTPDGGLFKKDEVAIAVGMAGACAWNGQLIFSLFVEASIHIIGFASLFIILAFFDIIGAIMLWMLTKVKDEEPQA